jgi:hypothetical protein
MGLQDFAEAEECASDSRAKDWSPKPWGCFWLILQGKGQEGKMPSEVKAFDYFGALKVTALRGE